jgi:16S rRNA (cytosine967-C5)-methyltransferase
MKLHRNLVQATAQALIDVLSGGMVADRYLDRLFLQHRQWGARDRHFVAHSLYEILRWYRRYAALAQQQHFPTQTQEALNLLGYHLLEQGIELPDWLEWETIRQDQTWRERLQELSQHFAIAQSYPDWLYELGANQLPLSDWQAALSSMNQASSVTLRCNRLRCTPSQVQNALAKDKISTQILDGDALLLEGRAKLQQTWAYQNGWFEVQDYSSQQVAPQLGVKPGMLVIDGCAGAGGKSLHLAALMQNEGRLVSLDIAANKLRQLQERAQRAGVRILQTHTITDSSQLRPWLGKADALLLDVPCSGSGVFRRQPESKWQLKPAFLSQLQQTQQQILQTYSPLCKPGAKLLYATCSILPQENQDQIQHFLQSSAGRGFQLLQQASILPQSQGHDGFYWALLQKD